MSLKRKSFSVAEEPSKKKEKIIEAHCILATNFSNVVQKHQCDDCQKFFKTNEYLQHHHQYDRCNNGESKKAYRGGCYEAPTTIFDRLLQFGIVVEEERKICKSFATWDCEAILEAIELKYKRKPTDDRDEIIEQRLKEQNIEVEYEDGDVPKQQFRDRHQVVTGALKSTVPNATDTLFFYNDDPKILVADMHNAMIELSDKNYEIQKEKFAKEFDRLQELHQQTTAIIEATGKDEKMGREKNALRTLEDVMRKLDQYCRQLTILTFNGSRYDLNLVKKYLFPKMAKEVRKNKEERAATGEKEKRTPPECQWPSCITKGKAIQSLNTKELKFLDVMMYTTPGTSLDKFIKAYNPNGVQKACYPYELIRTLEDLQRTEWPPKSAFFSTLKGTGISDEQYEAGKKIWDALPVKRMLEYTKVYNCIDVEPFSEACTNMAELFWNDFGIDIFKQATSIPGVTLAYLFQQLHKRYPSTRFGLFPEELGDLCDELYGPTSLVGGLSFIGQRIAVKDETPIRGNPNKLVKKIIGFDQNALYLDGIMQPMPTGYPDYWKLNDRGDQFERKSKTVEEILKERRCHGEVEFLKFKAWSENIYIHHAEHGEQKVLGIHGYRVDGFAPDAKPKPKVYNYDGCWWHYHDQNCLNDRLNLTNADKDIKAKDAAKDKELTELGFDIETTYECEWRAIKKVAKALQTNGVIEPTLVKFKATAKKYNEYLKLHPVRKFKNLNRVKETDMTSAILNGEVFGLAKIDIYTPDHLKEKFEDFPPVIKHAMVGREDIGEFMKQKAEANDLLQEPRDCLIGSYYGEQIWELTPRILFYQEHGVEVKKIYEVIHFDKEIAFDWFGKTVTEHRMKGGILAECFKLIGNSSYGKCITNLKKHKDNKIVDGEEAAERQHAALHHKTEEISDDCFHVHFNKREIKFDLPMIIGLSVYNYAKLRMLEFVYNVLFKFVSKDDYMFLESDTDSIYLALSAESFEEVVRPEMRAEFDVIKHKYFVQDESQKRTPGLMKVEKEADRFIGLCSKTYICDENAKAKGVQPRNEGILTFENFKKVLFDLPGAQHTAFNMGIRPDGNEVKTYLQAKDGLSNFYIKRICFPDGSSKPLLI